MGKVFKLVYGTIQFTRDELANKLKRMFDMDFEYFPKNSQTLAVNFNGTGIWIFENFDTVNNLWFCVDEAEFPVILYIESREGNLKNKLSVHKYLKRALNQLDCLSLLEEVIEPVE